MDEEGDQDYTGDGSDDEDDTNLMDYVHKKVKKKVEPSMETVQLKSYTEHPATAMFKAPKVDPQAPTLKFKHKKVGFL